MQSVTFPRATNRTLAVAVLLTFYLSGCAPSEEMEPVPPFAETEVAERMLQARRNAEPVDWLTEEMPELSREAGYRIQSLQLEMQEAAGATRIGWKMGGTRVTDPSSNPNPTYGYSVSSDLLSEDEPVSLARFVNGSPMIEAEVAIFIGKDLPGPEITREEFIDAIAGVGGAIEVVSPRLVTPEGQAPSTGQLLADNVSHAGAIPGDARIPVDSFDFDSEEAVAFIDGSEVARGSSSDIMGDEGTPLDAALWLANELPRHGMYLREGEFILTGSLYDNPTLLPGQTAEIEFSTLGRLEITLAGQ